MANVLLNFVLHNPIEVLVIGTIAYAITGTIMRFCNYAMGIWFGRELGRLLWLITALFLTYIYAIIKSIL